MDENLINESVNPTDKTFTQAEVNEMISKRLSKSEKNLLSKLGIESKEDIDGLLSKINSYDEMKNKHDNLLSQVNTLTGEKTKAQYTRVIEKANVDEDLVFSRDGDAIWKCRNCGHIVIGKRAPELCPVCEHPKSFFEIKAENY